MITVKIYEDEPYFESTKDAIKYMESTNYSNEVSVYDINDSRAYIKAMEIYKAIIEYNKGKPRWSSLPSRERFARKVKSWGFSDSIVNRIRESNNKDKTDKS